MRPTGFLCLGDNGADGREHILDAMVKLGNQDTLALLCSEEGVGRSGVLAVDGTLTLDG